MSPIEPPPCVWELPDPGHADEDGIAGIGADLLPGTVLAAYRAGLFPMPLGGRRRPGPLGWWSPDPRGIIPLDGLRISRSLRRSCARYEVRVDTAFEAVIDACAEPNRPGGWITPEIRNAYVALHRLGWAHSVETWTIEEGATRPVVTESGARAGARPDAPTATRPTVTESGAQAGARPDAPTATPPTVTESDVAESEIAASDVTAPDVATSTVDGGRPELSESKNLRDAGGRPQSAEDDGAGERLGGGRLVGGLYGVAIGGLFAGESMFHSAADASKVALVALVDMLREDGNGGAGRLLDVQWVTDHLATLGAVEISRGDYLRRLERALPLPLPSRLLGTARRG